MANDDEGAGGDVVDMWAPFQPGAAARKRKPTGRRRIEHPQLGELYCGVADTNKQRTSISIPQEMMDRMAFWQAKLKGTPFDSHQGMVRHGLHLVLEQLDQCDDVMLHPELRAWVAVDKARAQAEQDIRFAHETTELATRTIVAMEASVERGDAVTLARNIGKAEGTLELLPPKPRTMLAERIKHFESELAAMQRDGR